MLTRRHTSRRKPFQYNTVFHHRKSIIATHPFRPFFYEVSCVRSRNYALLRIILNLYPCARERARRWPARRTYRTLGIGTGLTRCNIVEKLQGKVESAAGRAEEESTWVEESVARTRQNVISIDFSTYRNFALYIRRDSFVGILLYEVTSFHFRENLQNRGIKF